MTCFKIPIIAFVALKAEKQTRCGLYDLFHYVAAQCKNIEEKTDSANS